MVKHIVVWKLKETAEGGAAAENAQKIKTLLEDLQTTIPEIREIEVGLNYNPTDAAYDVVLYSVFDDKAALDRYQAHPAHQAAASFVRHVTSARVVADYER